MVGPARRSGGPAALAPPARDAASPDWTPEWTGRSPEEGGGTERGGMRGEDRVSIISTPVNTEETGSLTHFKIKAHNNVTWSGLLCSVFVISDIYSENSFTDTCCGY